MTERFKKGDRVRVRDVEGYPLATGTVLQTRGYIGIATFQVDCTRDDSEYMDIRNYNLNFVDVEVL